MTRPPHTAPLAPPTGARPVLLLILALVFAQLLLGAHHAEHVAAGETDHGCLLCLTGNGLDQSLGADPLPAAPLGPVANLSVPPASPWVAFPPRAYRVRAPPAAASTA